MTVLRDSITALPSIAAALNGFIAVLVASLFKARPVVRVILIAVAGLLTIAAVGVTLYSQHRIVAQYDATAMRNAEIRKKLGDFIQQGVILIASCTDPTKEAPTDAVNGWILSVNDFLNRELGHSYSQRLLNPVGSVANVTCPDAEYSRLFRIVMGINAHLEQFSEQANF
jgi:hypothetical protein